MCGWRNITGMGHCVALQGLRGVWCESESRTFLSSGSTGHAARAVAEGTKWIASPKSMVSSMLLFRPFFNGLGKDLGS